MVPPSASAPEPRQSKRVRSVTGCYATLTTMSPLEGSQVDSYPYSQLEYLEIQHQGCRRRTLTLALYLIKRRRTRIMIAIVI